MNNKHEFQKFDFSKWPSSYFIQIFDMKSKVKINQFPLCGNYIRSEDIVMNDSQDTMAVAYLDAGYWHLMVFNLRTIIFNLNVNELFDIENDTLPISGYYAPFATCCFLQNDKIYFQFFRRRQKIHAHFIYDYKEQVVALWDA